MFGLDNFTSCDAGDQFAVRFQEIVPRKLGTRRPRDGFENLVPGLAFEGWHGKENHFDVAVGIAVTETENFLSDLGVDRQFLGELAAQAILQALAVKDLAARKFPLQAVGVRAMALADEDLVACVDDSGGYEDGLRVAQTSIVARNVATRGGRHRCHRLCGGPLRRG